MALENNITIKPDIKAFFEKRSVMWYFPVATVPHYSFVRKIPYDQINF